MKHEKSCGCIIVENNRVLLVCGEDDNGELCWSFPKGHQEPNETDIATALRETQEETGLDVEIIDSNPIKTGHLVKNGTRYKDIILFLAQPLSSKVKIQTDEITDARWVEFDKVMQLLSSDYYKDAWREAEQRLNIPQDVLQ